MLQLQAKLSLANMWTRTGQTLSMPSLHLAIQPLLTVDL